MSKLCTEKCFKNLQKSPSEMHPNPKNIKSTKEQDTSCFGMTDQWFLNIVTA